jgi:hypothetical protein
VARHPPLPSHQQKLKPHGLEWVNSRVMRTTHSSVGHRIKLDPKITADQRGHGVALQLRSTSARQFLFGLT